MPALEFKMKFGKNTGLIISPTELLERYFFGIKICTSNGEKLSDEAIVQKILAAQSMMENYLEIKFIKQIIQQNLDFMRSEWLGWGFLRCQFPVKFIGRLEGFINTVRQIAYPTSWVSISIPNDEKLLLRNIHLVPAGVNTPQTNSVVYAGITPHLGFFGMSNIPNYWNVVYCTGFANIPADITDAVGKLAAIQLFAILGDVLLGIGVASSSLGFDGLSQSISTTQSSGNSLFSGRIKQYNEELKDSMLRMRDYYKGISYTVA